MPVKEVVSLPQAIRATLSYFDLFDFPLTLSELEQYLYGWSAPREVIEEETERISGISHQEGYYFLAGREGIVKVRYTRTAVSLQLWKKVSRFRFLLTMCPFVRMAAVGNTLAYSNAAKESDIDLLIITRQGRLYTARFFIKLITHIFGMRVHHGKKAGRFCLSFFVSEEKLDFAPLALPFDPYFAYYILTAKPLFGEAAYKKWFGMNALWVERYFKRKIIPQTVHLKGAPIPRAMRSLLELLLMPLGGLVEILCARHQRPRDEELRKKAASKGGIRMTKDLFKFHADDQRASIAERFAERLNQVSL